MGPQSFTITSQNSGILIRRNCQILPKLRRKNIVDTRFVLSTYGLGEVHAGSGTYGLSTYGVANQRSALMENKKKKNKMK